MSDLISRNRAISILEQLDEHSLSGKMDISNAIYLLENQPAAYDIGKVVDQLEENSSRYTKKYLTPYGNNGYRDTKAISIHKAIEIVKQGSVSDDVCEWNGEQSRLVTFTRFTTTCGDNIDLQTNSELLKAFRYCPFCGRKLKIVGD